METILRGILPDNSDRLYYVLEKVGEEPFTGPHRDLFKIITSVYELTNGGILDAPTLEKILEAQPEEKLSMQNKLNIEELWEKLSEMGKVSDAEFKVSVEYLLDKNKEENLGDVLQQTAKILDYGVKEGQVFLHGVHDAVNFLLEKASEIEHRPQISLLEGNARDEKDELIQELYEGAAVKRIPTGITPIDEMTHGGAGQGELWMIGAYTGVGKSLMAINMAHNFVINGQNVIYVSLEMPRKQVRRRLMIRHALMDKFGAGGVSLTGLNNHRPDNPALTDEQAKRYMDAVADWAENPAYGQIPIIQAERDSRFSSIRAMINRWQSKMQIDAVIIDSLDLVTADTKRSSRRDELNEVIISGKNLAMSLGDGGIPVITPWQTSRDAFHRASSDFSDGQYTITAMAETSEAERRADLIVALLQKPDTNARLKVQTLKWRDGQPED